MTLWVLMGTRGETGNQWEIFWTMTRHLRRLCDKHLNTGTSLATCPSFPDFVAHSHARPRAYRDTRTWRQRLERQQSNWKAVIPSLIEAFLKWKYPEPLTSDTLDGRTPAPTSTDTPPAVDVDHISYDFSIDCVDLYSLSTSIFVPRTSSMTAMEALMIQGYLATSPVDPTLAVSIKTLELFRRLRSRKASLSVEAYAKVLCDLYAVSTVRPVLCDGH